MKFKAVLKAHANEINCAQQVSNFYFTLSHLELSRKRVLIAQFRETKSCVKDTISITITFS